jgi:hypothetical protein
MLAQITQDHHLNRMDDRRCASGIHADHFVDMFEHFGWQLSTRASYFENTGLNLSLTKRVSGDSLVPIDRTRFVQSPG